jgi:hypothetical protein
MFPFCRAVVYLVYYLPFLPCTNTPSRLTRTPSSQHNLSLPQYDTRMPRTVTEMEQIIRKRPIMGKVLQYFMTSLDNITSAPFVYLCKKPDPISIHRAVSYISNNEMTNLIYVVHFVDDRKAIRLRQAFLNKAQQQVSEGWRGVLQFNCNPLSVAALIDFCCFLLSSVKPAATLCIH